MPTDTPKTYVPHLRLTYGGVIGSAGGEIWSNTVNWANATGQTQPTDASIQAAVNALAAPLQAWFTKSGTSIPPFAFLRWAKLNWVGTNGRQLGLNTISHDFPANIAGGSNQNTFTSWVTTYAITLRTAKHRGLGHSGRVYPPCVQPFIDGNTGYADQGTAASMARNFATLLTEVQAQLNANLLAGAGTPADWSAVVVSAAPSKFSTVPVLTRITSVTVDRVPDVIHTRTNKLARAEALNAALPFVP